MHILLGRIFEKILFCNCIFIQKYVFCISVVSIILAFFFNLVVNLYDLSNTKNCNEINNGGVPLTLKKMTIYGK